MHTFLDTNILYGKFKLNNSIISWLKTYLQLTKSKAYLSEVSLKEIIFEYKKQLNDLGIKNFIKRFDNLNFKDNYNFDYIENKIDILWNEYEDFLKQQLHWWCEIIPADESFMGECINRAVNKLPPCCNKEEFRDTVIRLTYSKKINDGDKDIAFITNNSSDFWKELNLTLRNDIEEKKKNRVFYFNSLEKFLEEYYESLRDCVDFNYIKKNLLTEDFCLELFDQEKNSINIENLIDILDYESEFNRTDYISFIDMYDLYIKDRVKIKWKEYYIISITLEYETELEVYIWKYSFTITPCEYLEIDLLFEKESKVLSVRWISDHYFSSVEDRIIDKIKEKIEDDDDNRERKRASKRMSFLD